MCQQCRKGGAGVGREGSFLVVAWIDVIVASGITLSHVNFPPYMVDSTEVVLQTQRNSIQLLSNWVPLSHATLVKLVILKEGGETATF